MLTYEVLEHYKMKRVEQTDSDIIRAYKYVDEIINQLDDDDADALIEAIGNYVYGCASADDKALIRFHHIRLADATIWYCHDED